MGELEHLNELHLHSATRACLHIPALSASLQLRAQQECNKQYLKMPHQIEEQICPKCSVPWVLGYTVKMRMILDNNNEKRTKGGLNKKQRDKKRKMGKDTKREMKMVNKCNRCGFTSSNVIDKPVLEKEKPNIQTINTTNTDNKQLNQNAKKRAKARKAKSSLQQMMANKNEKTKSELKLDDFLQL